MWEDLTIALDVLGFAVVAALLVIELPAAVKPLARLPRVRRHR
jgi:hypothetical protein